MNAFKLTLAVALLAALPAYAQHGPGEHGTGPNGGRIHEGGGYHVELVPKEHSLDVYISDADEKAVAAAGYKGSAIFVVDGKPARIALEPAGGNRLTGATEAAVAPDAKGAVRLTKPDGTTASISFH